MSEIAEELLAVPQSLIQTIPKGDEMNRRIGTLLRFGSRAEMWVTDTVVGQHEDPQPPGFWTYLWILQNDIECVLWEKTGDGFTPLPVGRLLCFDGALPHATRFTSDSKGRGNFAFLAWDMPHSEYSLEQFRHDLAGVYPVDETK